MRPRYSHAIFILLLEHDRITDLFRGERDEKLTKIILEREREILDAIELLKEKE